MRASHAPEKWKLVLDALNKNDYDLANKLAIKYKFASKTIKEEEEEIVYDDIRYEPKKGDYVAQSPDGKLYCHEVSAALSRYLGFSDSYVGTAASRLKKHGGIAKSGKMKGWRIWKQ